MPARSSGPGVVRTPATSGRRTSTAFMWTAGGTSWVGGNGGEPESDDMLLKFTNEGELVMQIGHRGQSGGNTDTQNLKRPAEAFVHHDTNEVFVADGYGKPPGDRAGRRHRGVQAHVGRVRERAARLAVGHP